MKLAPLSEYTFNLHLPGGEQRLPQLPTRSGFTEAGMWVRRLHQGNIDSFENLSEFELILMQLDGSHIFALILV